MVILVPEHVKVDVRTVVLVIVQVLAPMDAVEAALEAVVVVVLAAAKIIVILDVKAAAVVDVKKAA